MKILVLLIILGVIFGGRMRRGLPVLFLAGPVTLGRVLARVLILLAVIAIVATMIWSIAFSFSLLSWIFF